MCDCTTSESDPELWGHFGRRSLIVGAGAAVLLAASASSAIPATANSLSRRGAEQPLINPRSSWGAKLPPKGELAEEPSVKFLLLHHTASGNDYSKADVPGLLGAFYRTHTTDKGWPDIAYNFLIDKFGGIWEGRKGSVAGPIQGDATGGSQGHAVLFSLIGDYSKIGVPQAAMDSLARVMAWQADNYGVNTQVGATVTFESRGSNRWPAGTVVTTSTISGHKDMSRTECPGKFASALLAEALPTMVNSHRSDVPLTTMVPPPPEISETTQGNVVRDDIAQDGGSTSTVTADESAELLDLPNEVVVAGQEVKLKPLARVVAASAVAGAAIVGLGTWIKRRKRSDQDV